MPDDSHELLKLFDQPLPSPGRLRKLLAGADPGSIDRLILNEGGFVYVLDYYLRLFPGEVASRLINSEDLSHDSLLELFNCQMLRMQRSTFDSGSVEEGYASLTGSYWAGLSRERTSSLFKKLAEFGEGNRFSAALILRNMNSDDFALLQNMSGEVMQDMLEVLKDSFSDIISGNLELFDFLTGVARRLDDSECLELLEGYTQMAVGLRISQNLVEEVVPWADQKSGRLPTDRLMQLTNETPDEYLPLVLKILHRRNMIPESSVDSLLKFKSETG